MEKTKRATVIPVSYGWSDVGSWNAVWELSSRDAQGNVTDGNPDKVTDVTDIWTFARDITSRDPNWKLVATEAGQ